VLVKLWNKGTFIKLSRTRLKREIGTFLWATKITKPISFLGFMALMSTQSTNTVSWQATNTL